MLGYVLTIAMQVLSCYGMEIQLFKRDEDIESSDSSTNLPSVSSCLHSQEIISPCYSNVSCENELVDTSCKDDGHVCFVGIEMDEEEEEEIDWNDVCGLNDICLGGVALDESCDDKKIEDLKRMIKTQQDQMKKTQDALEELLNGREEEQEEEEEVEEEEEELSMDEQIELLKEAVEIAINQSNSNHHKHLFHQEVNEVLFEFIQGFKVKLYNGVNNVELNSLFDSISSKEKVARLKRKLAKLEKLLFPSVPTISYEKLIADNKAMSESLEKAKKELASISSTPSSSSFDLSNLESKCVEQSDLIAKLESKVKALSKLLEAAEQQLSCDPSEEIKELQAKLHKANVEMDTWREAHKIWVEKKGDELLTWDSRRSHDKTGIGHHVCSRCGHDNASTSTSKKVTFIKEVGQAKPLQPQAQAKPAKVRTKVDSNMVHELVSTRTKLEKVEQEFEAWKEYHSKCSEVIHMNKLIEEDAIRDPHPLDTSYTSYGSMPYKGKKVRKGNAPRSTTNVHAKHHDRCTTCGSYAHRARDCTRTIIGHDSSLHRVTLDRNGRWHAHSLTPFTPHVTHIWVAKSIRPNMKGSTQKWIPKHAT